MLVTVKQGKVNEGLITQVLLWVFVLLGEWARHLPPQGCVSFHSGLNYSSSREQVCLDFVQNDFCSAPKR